MKRFFFAMFLAVAILSPAAAFADGPDDDYVNIYTLIQQGDSLNAKGQLASAIAKYVEAQNALKRFQNNYHDWNEKVVNYRLKYLATKIDELSSQPKNVIPATNTPPAISNPPVAPVTPPATVTAEPPAAVAVPATVPETTPPPGPTAAESQIANLQDQIHHLEANNVLLEAKLKEALSAQPATVDPQEFAKAQAEIKSLQKENDLLKASLAQVNTNAAPQSSEKARQELAEANRKVAQLTDANNSLAAEKEALQNRVKTFTADDATTTALRQENELLKKQVADLRNRPATAPQNVDLNQQLKDAQTRVAALQSDKEVLQSEKAALENRLKQTPAPVAATPPVVSTGSLDSVTANRIAQLEAQRDELQKSLEVAAQDVAGRRKGKLLAARLDDMTRQLATLRPRIDILEAKPVPYTAEELALLGTPANTLVAAVHNPSRKSVRELPAGAAVLLSQASGYFQAHEYDKAEQKYLEVLKLDDKNITTLADLASIQLQAGHTADAEKNVKAALAVDPNDDYSLFILGQLKFQEKNYNEAFDVLSRAAQFNPQNAKIQNFLGLTLSEKGLRGPAETAFRKAIQLDPGFAEAHMNLAVVYLTQQPPLAELARWHYQKALATGHAPNPHIEDMLNSAKASGAP